MSLIVFDPYPTPYFSLYHFLSVVKYFHTCIVSVMKLFWVADVGLILLKWQHSKLISLCYLFRSWPGKAKHYTPWEFSPYFTLRQQQHWHCLHLVDVHFLAYSTFESADNRTNRRVKLCSLWCIWFKQLVCVTDFRKTPASGTSGFIFNGVPDHVEELYVFSEHFTADLFVNEAQCNGDFAKNLLLKDDAVCCIGNRK